VFEHSHRATVLVSGFYDGNVTADEVPVVAGEVTADASAAIAYALTLEAPASWLPDNPLHPLERNGQTLVAQRGIILDSGEGETWDLGTFRVDAWEATVPYGGVAVDALGMAAVLDEARLEVPYSPARGVGFVDVAEALVDNLLPLEVDSSLPSRNVPAGLVWDEDRLGALAELAAAWPARFEVTPEGVATFAPPYGDPHLETPVARYVAGEDSTVVEYRPAGTREGFYNAVIARGEGDAVDGRGAVQAAAYLDSYSGPYGRVPLFYSSPLLTTQAQALAAARTRLAAVSTVTDRLEVSAIPDPRRRLGDVVEVDLGARAWVGRVVAYTMPLGLGDPMTLTVEGVAP